MAVIIPIPATLPSPARREKASRKTRAIVSGRRSAWRTMTSRPPARYRTTLAGASFSAARPIDFTPPMITSHVSTATRTPVTRVGTRNWLSRTTAIELGCVKGVVVRAAIPATSAYAQPSRRSPRPSRR